MAGDVFGRRYGPDRGPPSPTNVPLGQAAILSVGRRGEPRFTGISAVFYKSYGVVSISGDDPVAPDDRGVSRNYDLRQPGAEALHLDEARPA